jgi:hypothetical protein
MDAIAILDEIIETDSINPNYYLLKYKCLMKLEKNLDAKNLITYIFSKFPTFEKGNIEYNYFMLNCNYLENYEVDDLSEFHDFISLSTKNKVTIRNDLGKNN